MSANTYKVPNGASYTFFSNHPTEVQDSHDVAYFRANPDFQEIGIVDEAKDIASKAKKKIVGHKKGDVHKRLSELPGVTAEESEALASYYESYEEFEKSAKGPAGIREIVRLTGMPSEKAAEIVKKIKGV